MGNLIGKTINTGFSSNLINKLKQPYGDSLITISAELADGISPSASPNQSLRGIKKD